MCNRLQDLGAVVRLRLGDVHGDQGPRSGGGVDDESMVIAVDLAQPDVDVAQTDMVAVRMAGQDSSSTDHPMNATSSDTTMSIEVRVRRTVTG